MKTIILYASKYGAVREIARRIADRIPGAEVCDLKKDANLDIGAFDCVILGSSLYAGMIRKEMKTFLSQHASVLSAKRLGLFLSGLAEDKEHEYFENNFPPDILRAASVKSFLGGVYDPAKAGFMERVIMRMITKQPGYISNVREDKIDKFAEALKA